MIVSGVQPRLTFSLYEGQIAYGKMIIGNWGFSLALVGGTQKAMKHGFLFF